MTGVALDPAIDQYGTPMSPPLPAFCTTEHLRLSPPLLQCCQQCVRGSDETATDTTTLKGKYTESLTFGTPNCIYGNYGKLGKPSLYHHTLWNRTSRYGNSSGVVPILNP